MEQAKKPQHVLEDLPDEAGAANVLLSFNAPVTVRVLGMKRPASQIALHLDQPDEFLAAISSS